jgi:hypothetical protein
MSSTATTATGSAASSSGSSGTSSGTSSAGGSGSGSGAPSMGLSARETKELASALGSPITTTGMLDFVDVRVADLEQVLTHTSTGVEAAEPLFPAPARCCMWQDLLEPLNQKAVLSSTLTTLHSSDPKFAAFVLEEYEKLQSALKISHDSVLKWLNTLKALNKAIRSNAQRLTASVALHDAQLKHREELQRVSDATDR